MPNYLKTALLEGVSEAKIGLEKMKIKLESAICAEKDLKHRCSDLEQQQEELDVKLDQAEEQNSWYEDGHGLIES
eukprot:1955899-Ditylum_brightwellii.AAC.1